MNFQDFLSCIAQEDSIALSAYQFICRRTDAASTFLTELQEACASSNVVISTITTPLLVQIDEQVVTVDPQTVLNTINQGGTVISALKADGTTIEVSVEDVVDQITESVSASYAVAESFWVLAQSHLKTATDKMGAFCDRMLMKFSSIPDVASSYGYAILGVLEDNNASIIEKTKTILSFIGFGDNAPDDVLPIPQNDMSDITGANVYTAFSADVTEATEGVVDVAANVFAKIGNGIKRIVTAVAEPVVTKVKQAVQTLLTTHDAWQVSDKDATFRGFTDMGSVTKYPVGDMATNLFAKKLSTNEYLVFDLGLCRSYCWLQPDQEFYFIKTYVRPLPYNAFTYSTKVALSNGNQNASINDLIIAIMSNGAVAAPTSQEVYGVLAEVLSIPWETPDTYHYDEFETWNADAHMWVSIKHSQMAAALVLLCMSNEILNGSMSYANLKNCIEILFGDPDGFISSSMPDNPTNLDIARALTGTYNNTTKPGEVYFRDFVDIDPRAFIIQALGSILDDEQYYFSYYRCNSVPGGAYTVYRDSELASVVSTLVITVAIVVASVVILKTIGKAKRSIFKTKAKAAQLEREAFSNPGSIDQTKLDEAFKLNKKADLLQRITTGFAGSSKAVIGLNKVSANFAQTSGQYNLNSSNKKLFDDQSSIKSDVHDIYEECISIRRDITG